MSQEMAIVAIIQPAPGKLERVKAALVEGISWMEANEPETLEFSFYEEESEEGIKLFMFERYASRAAMEKHESSDNYKQFFKAMVEEELLAGAPVIAKGNFVHSFRR